jgi:preprotein translocase subunit YajC
MDLFVTTAWAQDAGAAPGGAWMQLLPLVLIFVVFYFLLIRPQTKRAKEHKEMIGKLQSGDKVVMKVQKFQVAQLMPKGTIKGV